MKLLLSAAEMRACDNSTIEKMGVPSLVLMERAAMSVCDVILSRFEKCNNIGVICGPGNNGGDGVAVARILHNKGFCTKVLIIGESKKFSESLKQELSIAKNYGVELSYIKNRDSISPKEFSSFFSECDLIVDAMFGIGLTRGLDGNYKSACQYINQSNKPVIAVDIPSGFDTDSGKLLGDAGVNATITVTFAYMKKGLVLGDCKEATGEIIVADVGIYCKDNSTAKLLDDTVLDTIPWRPTIANKGTCGKVLIIAGSDKIYGACYLAALAALCSGSGLVKIYTHYNNIGTIQSCLPEAMYTAYTNYDEVSLIPDISWADAIVVGPGLGTAKAASSILKTLSKTATVPVVIDADGLNVLAKDLSILDELSAVVPVILTPHLKEMERLCGIPVSEINYDMENIASNFAKKHNCIVVLKNHTEVITSESGVYYCTSGNEALATPGSGDVLAGIIGALLGQEMDAEDAAVAGCYVHGKAGTIAAKKVGIKGLLARDIISNIHELI